MKNINNGKVDETLKPNDATPIKAMQDASKRFRRRARSAKNPEGKLTTPAKKVRADANAPAWAKLNPRLAVTIGNITTTTALNRCSVRCAVQLAAKRPQLASGRFGSVAVSTLDKV